MQRPKIQNRFGIMIDRERADKILQDAARYNATAGIVAFLCAIGLAIALAIAIYAIAVDKAEARGFDYFFSHYPPTGKCPGREVAASYYWEDTHTASGERFDPNGNTAASRTLKFGTILHLKNPHNGKTVSVRINDRGPYGAAHRLGVKLDLARGAAKRLGMNQTGWVCIL